MNASIFLLRRPLVTEKSARLMEKHVYSFEVAPSATKGQIRAALKERFKVDAISVRTAILPGKYRRRTGPVGGYRSDWKKAIVRLKPGQQIKWEEAA